MTPKLSNQFDTLEQDLRLCDLDGFADRVQALKEALTPKPKAAKVSPPVQKYKLEITEGLNRYEVFVDGEKEVDKWLTQKAKMRKEVVGKKFPAPYWSDHSNGREMQKEKHYSDIAAAGLNFEILIHQLK